MRINAYIYIMESNTKPGTGLESSNIPQQKETINPNETLFNEAVKWGANGNIATFEQFATQAEIMQGFGIDLYKNVRADIASKQVASIGMTLTKLQELNPMPAIVTDGIDADKLPATLTATFTLVNGAYEFDKLTGGSAKKAVSNNGAANVTEGAERKAGNDTLTINGQVYAGSGTDIAKAAGYHKPGSINWRAAGEAYAKKHGGVYTRG